MVISVIIAEILASHSKASNTFKNYMVETLSNINNNLIEQEHKLTQEQHDDFFFRKKQVLIQLENAIRLLSQSMLVLRRINRRS
ncbi:Imm3 family immunity protein [Paenibacillus rhizoplanae]